MVRLRRGLLAGVAAACSPRCPASAVEGTAGRRRGEIDADDIGGVVTSTQGPEAGVWVVAETTDLPTRFIRIVATDDDGATCFRTCPTRPTSCSCAATASSILRGSPPRRARPSTSRAWWRRMPAPPPRFIRPPGGCRCWSLPEGDHSHQELGSQVTGCMNCHQVGNRATREIPGDILDAADSHLAAWDRRVAMGPMGSSMASAFGRLGDQRRMFADWTERIAAGEAPTQTPPRPVGIERNVVVTLWDWGTQTDGRTDSAASDVRDATGQRRRTGLRRRAAQRHPRRSRPRRAPRHHNRHSVERPDHPGADPRVALLGRRPGLGPAVRTRAASPSTATGGSG